MPDKLVIWQGYDHNGECKDCDEHADSHDEFCPYWKYCEASAQDYAAKIQHLVNMLDSIGHLEDHVYTFPDGDIWEAQNAQRKR